MGESQMLVSQIVPQADQSPFIVEQVAIDVTNALRGAGAGLRGFRARPLLRRIWESASDKGQERVAAIGSDLVTAQQASLTLIKEIMSHEERSLACIDRVLDNLLAVNRDLDAQIGKTERLARHVDEQVTSLRNEIAQVEQRVREEMKRLIGREAAMSRLTRSYLADNLHPGTGDLLEGALYLAQVTYLYDREPPEVLERERSLVMREIHKKLGGDVRDGVELFLRVVEQIRPEMLEAVAYLTSQRNTPHLRVINMLVERKMVQARTAKISVGLQTVEETMAVVRTLYDPDDELAYFQRPADFARSIANELETYGSRGGQ